MSAPGDANLRQSDQMTYLMSDAVLFVKPRTGHVNGLQSIGIQWVANCAFADRCVENKIVPFIN